MILPLFFLLFISVYDISDGTRLKRQAERCTTPNGAPGSCKNIRVCPPLIPLLKRVKQDQESANFLRRSKCGGYAEVCCPIDINTPSPQSQDFELNVENCGRSNVTMNNKVVGGSPAELGAWPWIAALGYRSITEPNIEWRCGGSLLNKRYVLTAAHCINTPPTLYLKLVVVRLGEHDLLSTTDGARPVDYGIEQTIIHEDYKSQSNDIALIRLEKDVLFTDTIRPICLPQAATLRNSDFVKKYPFVAGWGETNIDGPSSDVLLQVQVPVVENEMCRTAYARYGATITNKHLCAGEIKGGKDSCRGDSGGPLMLPQSGVYYQIGVISFGYKCAEPGYPGVYTRVTAYLDWVKNNIK